MSKKTVESYEHRLWEPKRPKIDVHANATILRGSPLGLTLTKTPCFLELIETKLSKKSTEGERKQKKRNKTGSSSHKLKASNIPALSLQVGSWKRVASYDGDLVAKCYFAKQKLVWEVLCEGLKSKMEIHWLQVSAIRALFFEGHPDLLEIELHKPPTYFRESAPKPRKHTMWLADADFTKGQAQIYKRHILQFPEGTLEMHYRRLLQCDPRLYELSRRAFPDGQLPFFGMVPVRQHPYLYCQIPPNLCNISAPAKHIVPDQSTSPPIAMNFQHVCKDLSVPMLLDSVASNSAKHFQPINAHDIPVCNRLAKHYLARCSSDPDLFLSQQALEINSIAHQLPNEPQSRVHANEKSLLVEISSFGSALYELSDVPQVASRPKYEGYYQNAWILPKF